ncbi:MAG: substrate-binding domain-containing protein [Clostridiales bacterium]|nr:substrate-binding domain-containing protein [Clostridiales bacterium]
MKKLLSLLLALSMVLSLAACGGSSTSTTSDSTDSDTSAAADTTESGTSTAASDIKIAYIPKERAESFWQAVEAGAQAAADDLGVELVMYGDAAGSNTAANQSTYVETATELGVNAIVFAALDSDSTDAALQSAQAEGITVVGFDSDPGAEARDWFVNQVDPDELAAVLLDDLVENIGDQYTADDPAEVYLVSTNLTTPNQNSWIEAIKRAYYTDYETVYDEDGAIDQDACNSQTKSGSYTVNEQYEMLNVHVDPGADGDIIYAGDGDGLTELESFLTAHSDANALVSLTTNVIASCNSAIQSCGLEGQCIFNGIATPSDSEAYLENGNMTTVVLWQAYDLGYLAINTAYSAVAGELESGAAEYVSNLCGQTQVEGVSTYADTHKVDGATVYLGGPATFTLDTLDCWKS